MLNNTWGSNQVSLKSPQTQQQKLAFFEDLIVGSYIAPYRNKHLFGASVMPYDSQHCFYYGDQYTYGNDDINTYQQVIINNDTFSDRYATFVIDQQDEKNLVISYTEEK